MILDQCWPVHLEAFDYGPFICFLEHDNGAWLVNAYAGGVDVVDYLADDVIRRIECTFLSSRP